MRTILITGSSGFIGRSLAIELARRADVVLLRHDIDNTRDELHAALALADVVYHLAGVNRPQDPQEFETGNAGLTQEICQHLIETRRAPKLILSSSTQAALDNPYGVSKRRAEDEVYAYAAATGAEVAVYRLPNVFGMGCRPNYNSAVATFCHNIAHDLPVQVSDPAREMELVYIDDVVEALLEDVVCGQLSVVGDCGAEPMHSAQAQQTTDELSVVSCQLSVKEELPPDAQAQRTTDNGQRTTLHKHSAEAPQTTDNRQPTTLPAPTYRVTLGRIVGMLESFKRSRTDLQVPDQADGFSKKLYATYLSYLPVDQFSYFLKMNVDARGSFTEFIKTPERGQVSINISKPHITKGNHWHHTKNEKFLVVSGRGVIRLRKAGGGEEGGQRSEIGGQGSETRDQNAANAERALASLEKFGADLTGIAEGKALANSEQGGEALTGMAEGNPEVDDCKEELPHSAQAPQTADLRPPTSDLPPLSEVLEYHVSGEKLEVVDIPPGYTHNIENLGDTDMVTVMWANEALDLARPDTVFEVV